MPNFAVISGKQVTRVIVADSLEFAELHTKSNCLEITEELPIGLGWVYDDELSEWYSPNPNTEDDDEY
jgi:hypothetical protein